MKKLWNWICSLFTWESIGAIWEVIFTSLKSETARMLCDPDNHTVALTFVRMLAKEDIPNAEKAEKFNAQMKEWAKKAGKNLGEAVINALRENAVCALKCEESER